jgi:hypothetical protein
MFFLLWTLKESVEENKEENVLHFQFNLDLLQLLIILLIGLFTFTLFFFPTFCFLTFFSKFYFVQVVVRMFLQSKEGINVLQVWSLSDLTEFFSTSLNIRQYVYYPFLFISFFIWCLQVFPTFVCLGYCQDVLALFV